MAHLSPPRQPGLPTSLVLGAVADSAALDGLCTIDDAVELAVVSC